MTNGKPIKTCPKDGTDPRFQRIVDEPDLPFRTLFWSAVLWIVLVIGGTLTGWSLSLFITQWAQDAEIEASQ